MLAHHISWTLQTTSGSAPPETERAVKNVKKAYMLLEFLQLLQSLNILFLFNLFYPLFPIRPRRRRTIIHLLLTIIILLMDIRIYTWKQKK
jgi:hypothetical protein